jgi:pyruvate dehydrogenase complex dehydrogenase (E1) component
LTRTSVHDSHLDGSDENDVKIIAEFEAARSALGRLVVDVEWVVVQDAMLADLTAYRAGLDVLRKLYRV